MTPRGPVPPAHLRGRTQWPPRPPSPGGRFDELDPSLPYTRTQLDQIHDFIRRLEQHAGLSTPPLDISQLAPIDLEIVWGFIQAGRAPEEFSPAEAGVLVRQADRSLLLPLLLRESSEFRRTAPDAMETGGLSAAIPKDPWRGPLGRETAERAWPEERVPPGPAASPAAPPGSTSNFYRYEDPEGITYLTNMPSDPRYPGLRGALRWHR